MLVPSYAERQRQATRRITSSVSLRGSWPNGIRCAEYTARRGTARVLPERREDVRRTGAADAPGDSGHDPRKRAQLARARRGIRGAPLGAPAAPQPGTVAPGALRLMFRIMPAERSGDRDPAPAETNSAVRDSARRPDRAPGRARPCARRRDPLPSWGPVRPARRGAPPRPRRTPAPMRWPRGGRSRRGRALRGRQLPDGRLGALERAGGVGLGDLDRQDVPAVTGDPTPRVFLPVT